MNGNGENHSKFTPAVEEALIRANGELLLVHVFFPGKTTDYMDLCKQAIAPRDENAAHQHGFVVGYEGVEENGTGQESCSIVSAYLTKQGLKRIATLENAVKFVLTKPFLRETQQRGVDGEYPHEMRLSSIPSGPKQPYPGAWESKRSISRFDHLAK